MYRLDGRHWDYKRDLAKKPAKRGRTTMQPNEGPKKMIVRKGVFDLDSFEDVTLAKEVEQPEVKTMAEAMAFFNNDNAALLAAINSGIVETVRERTRQSTDGWFYLSDKNPNEVTDKAFEGTAADPSGVRATIMTLAKTVFGYVSGRGLSDAQKAKNGTAKEKAETMVRNNDDIREGLKQAALEAQESE